MGPHQSPSSFPIQRRGERFYVAGLVISDYEDIEQNLEGLTMDILEASIDDIPRRYQHHTVGISTSIG
jgi:hypothetical protein